jgi:hypothetical protein
MEGSKAPPVLYHGSLVHETPMGKNSRPLGDIDTFDRHAAFKGFNRPEGMDAIGTWLSETSGGYTSKNPGAGLYAPDSSGAIYPVHANIKNPWKPKDFNHFLDEMHRSAGRDPKTQNPRGRGSVTELRDDLIASGYDGIYFKQGLDHADQSPTWVAFEPTQSKSAIGNRGTFDPNEPDITKAQGGPIRKASGGLSRVNEAGNYTKPGMRKQLFNSIKARAVQGTGAGQWSARKAQLLAKSYKEKGGGYKD